jgi:aspartate-semialdehyde dehydrogenase
MSQRIDVVVAGATGMVGRTMLRVLEERAFPVGRLIPMASARSAGQTVRFRGEDVRVVALTRDALKEAGAPLALFSAGGAVSREYSPFAAQSGTLVIDNSSTFRMESAVPLVVPEVNPEAIASHRGIIANPNCSTIQMVVALKPLHDSYRIRRIVVATYQSVTGAGQRGYDQLAAELSGHPVASPKFPHPIAMNIIPQIDEFTPDGYTKEERKMMEETKKILGDPAIKVTATCVRVPVVGGHSEAVTVEFEREFALDRVRALLEAAPGVVLQDEPARNLYPMPRDVQGRDEVFVGRIRRDVSVPNGLSLWIVADNVRKGAATNAVQIAEEWLRRDRPGLSGPK